VDGTPVRSLFAHLEISPEHTLWSPPGGLHRLGFSDPCVSGGYWLMLAPLPPGLHELTFGGTRGGLDRFTLDITYHVTVAPAGASESRPSAETEIRENRSPPEQGMP
jgi:hypothetical protein